jgi:DNA-binding NarL/FixJ family response regulator
MCTILGQHPQLIVAGEAADGLEAIKKIADLLPDLILLDIALPELNGLEVASRARELSPNSKILIISETRSAEVAGEAFRRGALGYVVKSGAAMELWPAVEAVLQGRRFISTHLNGRVFEDSGRQEALGGSRDEMVPLPSGNAEKRRRHEVQFYPDDAAYVAGLTHCVETVLKRGDTVIVIATAPHRASLLPRLKSNGVKIDAEIARGNLVLLDALETLSTIMVDNMPDAGRCGQEMDALIAGVAGKSAGGRRHVAFCGQCAPVLLSQGNIEGAIHWSASGTKSRSLAVWRHYAVTYRANCQTRIAPKLSSESAPNTHACMDWKRATRRPPLLNGLVGEWIT